MRKASLDGDSALRFIAFLCDELGRGKTIQEVEDIAIKQLREGKIMNQNELVIQETGELIEIPEVKPTNGLTVPFSFEGIGTSEWTQDQKNILAAEIEDKDIDIMPTKLGEIYASQIIYRKKLNEAFGPGQWGMRPLGPLMIKDNKLCRSYALIVNGKTVSDAMGAQEYYPNNPRMSYADAAESAKSDALKKCCKDLLIAWQCWDKRFCEDFKKRLCGKDSKGNWYRKDAEAMNVTIVEPVAPQQATEPKKRFTPEDLPVLSKEFIKIYGVNEQALTEEQVKIQRKAQEKGTPIHIEVPVNKAFYESKTNNPPPLLSDKISEAQGKRFYAIAKTVGSTDEQIKQFLLDYVGSKSTRDIPKDRYKELCEKMEATNWALPEPQEAHSTTFDDEVPF